IDLCHGRRDGSDHRGDPQPAPLDERYGPTPPWHDATLEIRGPAVAHVLDVFSERWDDPTPLDHRNPYRRLLQNAARMPRHPQPLPERWDPPRVRARLRTRASAGLHRGPVLLVGHGGQGPRRRAPQDPDVAGDRRRTS